MDPVIAHIRKELKNSADPATQKTFQRFFKEEIQYYGVKVPTVSKIARKYWKEIKVRDKKEIFSLCEELFRSNYCEEAFIVSSWAHLLATRYEKKDLPVFRHWIDTYITNWATCDSFCNHTMGSFIEKYPEYLDELKHWTQSNNRWMRRAAAVSLIIPAKRGKYLDTVLEIADLLLTDRDDMVRKGYGWLLKEASRKHRKEVFDYVLRNKKSMPRTALRYAIELMPEDLREEAMKKNW
ncbi:MAG: DNA alkylation repair protein [Methanoregula sp.]|jgi:3-methyladenine DNA glycosylase AlkD